MVVAVVEAAVSRLGVTAYARASAAVAKRAVFVACLAVCLSWGRTRMVLIVPAKISGKCFYEPSFFSSFFRRNVGQKLRLIRIIND
jgi:hypothetical protein